MVVQTLRFLPLMINKNENDDDDDDDPEM